MGRLNSKKRNPVSENVSASVEEEKEKTETEILTKVAHHPLSKVSYLAILRLHTEKRRFRA